MDYDNVRLPILLFCVTSTLASFILSYLGQPAPITSAMVVAAAIVGGAPIIAGAVKAVISRDFNVDFLASIAIATSIIIGEYMAAALVVIMLTGGKSLEDYAAEKATRVIEKLVKSSPRRARVYRNGDQIEVPIEEVRLRDIVIVKPGEKIPVDGRVIKGYATVNQATITGESIPVEKVVGSQIYSNTIIEAGALEIEVTKVGEETTFAQIINLVREAQSRKAPIERVADRYARLFTPIVLALAALAFVTTRDVVRTISILVIACPCALTLATPAAVIASIGNAAKRGILIKGGSILEKTSEIDMIVMDKTGTLTVGQPKVVAVKGFCGRSDRDIIFLAAIAEKLSEHPLAKTVLKKAEELGINPIDPSEFRSVPGYGVIARHGHREILVGSTRLIESRRVEVEGAVEKYVRSQEEEGRTVLLVAERRRLVGVISVADELKEDVPQAIKNMKKAGVKELVMLTGDNPYIAEAVARRAGIDEVKAALLPKDKVAYIEQVKSRYSAAMVGDGINDAPALASADVGVAMGVTGTDIAIETAGIILTTNEIGKVSDVIALSKKTMKVIRQNILFSLAVNVLGVILSMSGVVNPVVASIIHESNALLVVLNSVRLINYRK